MNTKIKTKYISIIAIVAVIGIIVVGLGMLAFSLKIPVYRETKPNVDFPQPLRGIITQVELGKDGLQIELQTDYILYNVTISKLQTEIIGSFDQIVVGAEIEVSGRGIVGMEPPLIVAEHVWILGSSTEITGNTWVLITYNDQQPISGHQPTLRFETEQVSGYTGCNHYGGTYQLKDDTIRFEGVYSTEMACLDPEGLMEQERIYLELLVTADRFELVDETLALFAGPNQILTFEKEVVQIISTNPTFEDPNTAITSEYEEPTFIPAIEVPAGFREYRDSVARISVYIPEDWVVFEDGVIEGQYAIFMSYPKDKYIGGEAREPGDTKCDLNLHPSFTGNAMDLINQWKSDPMGTTLSEEEIILDSGEPGTRIERENRGHSISIVTEINNRVISLTCWGEFDQFDEIAVTLRAYD